VNGGGAGAVVALFALWALSQRGGSASLIDSAKEDGGMEESGASIIDARLRDAVGVPFSYGAGTPASPWPVGAVSILGPSDAPAGWDCSGLVQAALVQLGQLESTATDRTAQQLHDDSRYIITGETIPTGALGFYGAGGEAVSHVVVAGGFGSRGAVPVLSASGGTSRTFGTDPNARVKVWPSEDYRSDFLSWRTLT